MNKDAAGKRTLAIACLVIGAIALIAALVVDFTGMVFAFRGETLIVGVVLILAGLYTYPTVTHHRNLINFIFLFPLLFAFLVTVIIPLILGIGYSFTDWNGIRINNVVGLNNYISTFKEPSFCILHCSRFSSLL